MLSLLKTESQQVPSCNEESDLEAGNQFWSFYLIQLRVDEMTLRGYYQTLQALKERQMDDQLDVGEEGEPDNAKVFMLGWW